MFINCSYSICKSCSCKTFVWLFLATWPLSKYTRSEGWFALFSTWMGLWLGLDLALPVVMDVSLFSCCGNLWVLPASWTRCWRSSSRDDKLSGYSMLAIRAITFPTALKFSNVWTGYFSIQPKELWLTGASKRLRKLLDRRWHHPVPADVNYRFEINDFLVLDEMKNMKNYATDMVKLFCICAPHKLHHEDMSITVKNEFFTHKQSLCVCVTFETSKV